ncbi:hypothetical protein MMC07_003504 [Pseudocyphellaria aurata]|nr:hypothetical protein [Pseudocyphellaria aurata]
MHISSVCPRFSTFSSFNRDIRPSYNFTKRLRQNCDSVRLLHRQDVGGLAKAHRAPPFEEWNGRANTTIVKKKAEDSKDIIIDDLFATLEAHRVTNRSKFIRKLLSGPRLDPSLDKNSTLDQIQTAPADVEFTIPKNKTDSSTNVATGPTIIKKQLMGIKRKPSVILDYEGVAKEPCKRWNPRLSKRGEQSPWLSLVTTTEGDGLARLQYEIIAYEKYMSLKAYEMVAASSVFEELNSIVGELSSSVSIDILGSYSSGLATPTSDMDLGLSLPSDKHPLNRGPSPGRKEFLKAGSKSLHELHRVLLKSKSFGHVGWSGDSRQTLDAVHSNTKLAIQIQFTPKPLPSLPYILTYLSEYPTLRPLFILLRSALNIRGLNSTGLGGLSSYRILMMIVYALGRKSSELPRHDSAAQLLSILKLYSEANLYQYGFSVDPPRMFNKTLKGLKGNSTARILGVDVMLRHKEESSFYLCLQDPADPTNDLGRGAYGIKHVQAVFRSARERIERAMCDWEGMSRSERQNVNAGCLDPLVGASYTYFERQRAFVKRAVEQTEVGQHLSEETEENFQQTRMFARPLEKFLVERRRNPSFETAVPLPAS